MRLVLNKFYKFPKKPLLNLRFLSDIVKTKEKEGDKMTMDEAFERLEKSTFRAKFHLSEKDKKYVREKGIETIREHCEDFVRTRLAPAYIPNDGKQTPMRGHPMFVAQHATACCCRGCLNKWYKVPKGVELTELQQKKIVNLMMTWIEREMDGM